MQLAVIVAIVIAIAGVMFAVQNSVPSTLVFPLWRFDGSPGVILLLALGALIVALVSTPSTVRANRVIKRQQKEIDGPKSANAELRARTATAAAGPDTCGPAGFKSFAAASGTSARETETMT